MREVFEANFAERGELGAACCVVRRGEVVVDLWGGVRDARTGARWDADTMTTVFSTTKGVSAIALAVAASRGWLDYDERVATYWPEFAQEGKGDITVRQLLAHQAGLAAVDTTFDATTLADLDFVARGLAAQRPAWRPGEHHGYHAMTIGFYESELLRRVDPKRRSLGVFLREEITAPHGLDFHIGLPETLEPRVARLYPPEVDPEVQSLVDAFMADPSTMMGRVMSGPSGLFRYDDMWNTRALHATEMPSSNGIGDARSLARLYAACVGEVRTATGPFRALSDATVAAATVLRSEGTDEVLGMPLDFGLGFAGPTTLALAAGPRAFGHSGAGGSLAFADPDAGVGFGYVMNQMRLDATGDPRAESLAAAVYSALG